MININKPDNCLLFLKIHPKTISVKSYRDKVRVDIQFA
jgi:hypothetical protein